MDSSQSEPGSEKKKKKGSKLSRFLSRTVRKKKSGSEDSHSIPGGRVGTMSPSPYGTREQFASGLGDTMLPSNLDDPPANRALNKVVSADDLMLRKRYRSLFREEIARTVRDEEEVEEEMRALMQALGR